MSAKSAQRSFFVQYKPNPPRRKNRPEQATLSPEPHPKKLLDQIRDALQARHDSIRTENAYVDWARRIILFQTIL